MAKYSFQTSLNILWTNPKIDIASTFRKLSKLGSAPVQQIQLNAYQVDPRNEDKKLSRAHASNAWKLSAAANHN
jgi:hypothetical protein